MARNPVGQPLPIAGVGVGVGVMTGVLVATGVGGTVGDGVAAGVADGLGVGVGLGSSLCSGLPVAMAAVGDGVTSPAVVAVSRRTPIADASATPEPMAISTTPVVSAIRMRVLVIAVQARSNASMGSFLENFVVDVMTRDGGIASGVACAEATAPALRCGCGGRRRRRGPS
jgi:hypothetical protein